MTWRKKTDPIIKEHLEAQIKESYIHKKAYSEAKDPKNAQLWIAVANLSKQVFDLNLKVKFLEKTLREISGKKSKKEPDDDIKKILDTMQKF